MDKYRSPTRDFRQHGPLPSYEWVGWRERCTDQITQGIDTGSSPIKSRLKSDKGFHEARNTWKQAWMSREQAILSFLEGLAATLIIALPWIKLWENTNHDPQGPYRIHLG
ncbi:hypothetical protein V6Z88_006343 [Aspergillus fumigatus]